jgi:hypothetical protein
VPEPTHEDTEDSIQIIADDSPNTSVSTDADASISFDQPKRARGRPRKSDSAPPPPRARSVSAQPPKAKSTPASTTKNTPATKNTGVRGRKPKLAVVPETQPDPDTIEEQDEVDEVIDVVSKVRQEDAIPTRLSKKPSSEVFHLIKASLTDRE